MPPKFLECPVRLKEIEVARVRGVQLVPYLEALRRLEGTSGKQETKVLEPPPQMKVSHKMLHVKKVDI